MLAVLLMGCASEPLTVAITMINEGPIEVDTLQDPPVVNESTGELEYGPYYAEELTALVTYTIPDYMDPTIMESIHFNTVKITYTSLNAEGDIPTYENGFAGNLNPGEYQNFILRATSFAQKDWAGLEFSGQPVNVRASLQLIGATSRTEETVIVSADLDMIFADFKDGTTQGAP
jgi:hypothetical protein